MKRTPEEAVRIAVESLGGLQAVGYDLKPEQDPVAAGIWLSHCLTEARRDNLTLRRLVRIFRNANAKGTHEGFEAFAAVCGYSAEPIATDSQLVEAVKRAQAAKREADESARDLSLLIENPRLFATMKAAGLKVDV